MNRDEVCCLTPAGACAIAVVGLRGPAVWQKISPYFTSMSRQAVLSSASHTYLGKLRKDDLGDDVVLVLQGTEVCQTIELQMHGGPGVVAWCMEFAESLGCRRIDWPQWCDNDLWRMLPLTTTKKTAGIVLDQCHGAIDKALSSIRERLATDPYDRPQLLDEVNALLHWESLGRHLIDPWKIVLVGPPNVGKSSLLNALLGYDRAITSAIPGTTRDLVTATLVWEGYLLEFIDTAGLRSLVDDLESAGMEKARQMARDADVVLWLIDLSQANAILPDGINPTLCIGTKADLPRQCSTTVDLAVSATAGTGLRELLTIIHKRLVPLEPVPGQPVPILTIHAEELRQLRQRLAE